MVRATLKSPMDFSLSMARGFHNAPKLYGDKSVRQVDKITGIDSGWKAAGRVRSLRVMYSYAKRRRNFALAFTMAYLG